MPELGKLLAYGISGLGLALAILAYLLLQAEQKIAKPRRSMIRAIYVFMGFSVTLVAFGLGFESLRMSNENVAAAQLTKTLALGPIPVNATDELWYDVLRATRSRLFGTAPAREYTRGVLMEGEERAMPVLLRSGECKTYFSMTKPPAQIDVTSSTDEETLVTALGRENHLIFGRVCRAKSPREGSVNLTTKMIAGAGPFVLETYGSD